MIFDKTKNEWVNTWANKKRVTVTWEQHCTLTDFWDEMNWLAHMSDMPQTIKDILIKTMDEFPLWDARAGAMAQTSMMISEHHHKMSRQQKAARRGQCKTQETQRVEQS